MSSEILEGYAVDVACLRKYPRAELAERARSHTQDGMVVGHCVESGFGLVDDEARIALLASGATLGAVDAVRRSGRRRGVRLRVTRQMKQGEMVTAAVEEAAPVRA